MHCASVGFAVWGGSVMRGIVAPAPRDVKGLHARSGISLARPVGVRGRPYARAVFRYGPSTRPDAMRRLAELQRTTRLRFAMQVQDVTGPQHDQTFTVVARATDEHGRAVEVLPHGTGSRAAKRGAAEELLRQLAALPAP